ncbi:MAG: GNAT family N-acetyltransferase, partial [Candidatus Kerfeldbacteria bacterium]|nr:GNAT family N-acetyltransferase [Candidatus Kerfeldbacteria bacterium]
VILVAEEGGRPAGFGAVWIEHDDEADAIMRAKNTYAYVADVFVDENARQKGTGTKLLAALEREAKKRGAKEAHMHMLAHNVVMRLVASKAGYAEEEIEVVKSFA